MRPRSRSPTRSAGARVAAIATAIALIGCAYREPLSPEPQASVDITLLGRWRCMLDGNDEPPKAPFMLSIAADVDRYYWLDVEDDGSKNTDRYRLHLSSFGSVSIANVRLSKSSTLDFEWYLLRAWQVRGDILDVAMVQEPGPSAAAVAAHDSMFISREDFFRLFDFIPEMIKPRAVDKTREELTKDPENPALYSRFAVCLRQHKRSP